MPDASLSQSKIKSYHGTREAMLEARNSRLKLQTPAYQVQVAKAEGNLQLINMILMSFSAEQNACIDQRVNLSQHMHRTEEALRTMIYEMK
ncbi:hypothetical protein CKAH01_18433 [Colletotrichum kahawae]|uniref:Uncharacterized protein n=1 Tax=Colletotrichum kahawae TaxID=34407 RepID=A0AAD9Y823_COLKA|nr:hypothetical protein CKAH01_18433 [Colletotrichum kahawae]